MRRDYRSLACGALNGFKKFDPRSLELKQMVVHAPETFLSQGTLLTGLYPYVHESGIRAFDENMKARTIWAYLRPTHKFFMQVQHGPFGMSVGTGELEKSYGYSSKIDKSSVSSKLDLSATFNWIKENKDSNFFSYIHLWTLRLLEQVMDARVDKTCEANDIGKVMRAYGSCIDRIDVAIESLYDFLEANDLFKNTMVVITTDHGEAFKLWDNHILGSTGAAWILHNGARYDEAIVTPFILSYPNCKSREIYEQVRQVDILPSILKVMNVPHGSMDGEAIDFDDVEAKDVFVFNTSETKDQALRTKDGWKLIFGDDKIELYDLNTDPKEQKNIADIRPDKVTEVFSLIKNFPTSKVFTSKELLFRYTDYKNIEYVDNLFKELGILGEWERRAKTYNQIGWVKNEKYLHAIAEMLELNSNHEVLEAGCWTGIISDYIKSKVKASFAIDPCPTMLKQVPSGIKIKVGSAVRIPYGDEVFDRVFMRGVIHHFEQDEIRTAIKEVLRVLKKAGLFLIAEGVPIRDEVYESFKSLLEGKENRIVFTGQHLLDMMGIYFEDVKYYEVIIEQQSIINWLDATDTDPITKSTIWRKHVNHSEMKYKEMANFRFPKDLSKKSQYPNSEEAWTEQDTLADMRKFIITGRKS